MIQNEEDMKRRYHPTNIDPNKDVLISVSRTKDVVIGYFIRQNRNIEQTKTSLIRLAEMRTSLLGSLFVGQ